MHIPNYKLIIHKTYRIFNVLPSTRLKRNSSFPASYNEKWYCFPVFPAKTKNDIFSSKSSNCNNPVMMIVIITSNNKHDWTPLKYLNVYYHNRTQKQLWHLFDRILQKYYQLPILGTLDISGHSHWKR